MKLSEFIIDVGRPIAYYPGLRKITGSTNATIFICQLIYWTGKSAAEEGWIFKVSEEIEQETGLSYDEQKTAREKLIKLNLIQERYDRLNHIMFYRVNLDELDKSWANAVMPVSRTPQHGIREDDNPAVGNTESQCSLIGNTETTAQTTTEIPPLEKTESKPRKTAAIKKGDLMDGILAFARPADPLADYPPDVQDVLKAFTRLWVIDVPIKARRGKSPDYELWCNGARQILIATREYGLPILDQVFLDWQKRPFTVSHPGAIVRVITGKVVELRTHKVQAQSGQFTRDPARAEKIRQAFEQDRLNKSVPV
jgi:hypothetical protein